MKNTEKKQRATWVGFKPLIGPTKKTKIRRAEKKYKKDWEQALRNTFKK